MTIISEFLSKVQAVNKTGAATEHSYRSALETLFSTLAEGVTALNEPKRVACGAPDFIIQLAHDSLRPTLAESLDVHFAPRREPMSMHLQDGTEKTVPLKMTQGENCRGVLPGGRQVGALGQRIDDGFWPAQWQAVAHGPKAYTNRQRVPIR